MKGRLRDDTKVSRRESGFNRDKMGKSAEEACFVEEEFGSGHVLKTK